MAMDKFIWISPSITTWIFSPRIRWRVDACARAARSAGVEEEKCHLVILEMVAIGQRAIWVIAYYNNHSLGIFTIGGQWAIIGGQWTIWWPMSPLSILTLTTHFGADRGESLRNIAATLLEPYRALGCSRMESVGICAVRSVEQPSTITGN